MKAFLSKSLHIFVSATQASPGYSMGGSLWPRFFELGPLAQYNPCSFSGFCPLECHMLSQFSWVAEHLIMAFLKKWTLQRLITMLHTCPCLTAHNMHLSKFWFVFLERSLQEFAIHLGTSMTQMLLGGPFVSQSCGRKTSCRLIFLWALETLKAGLKRASPLIGTSLSQPAI